MFTQSALLPMAVFQKPVVLSLSAPAPVAVLKSPSVLLKSAARPVAVLNAAGGVVLERINASGRIEEAFCIV